MLVNGKHTGSNWLSFWDVFNYCVMHTSWVGVLLFLRVRAEFGYVPDLVAVVARSSDLSGGSRVVTLTCSCLWYSYLETLLVLELS